MQAVEACVQSFEAYPIHLCELGVSNTEKVTKKKLWTKYWA